MAKQKKNLDSIADKIIAEIADEVMAAVFENDRLKKKVKKLLYENREVFDDGI